MLAIEDEYQIQLKQEELQNNDDTSLFREVEDTIDEDSDEDAYRMLKSLQEVSEEDEVEEYENTNHDKEQDEIHSDDDDESYNDDDEEEEEDDDELSTEFPEFQNEATTEFFETLPKQPIDSLDSKINSGQDTIEEEELDEEIDELEPDQEEEEEENINKEIEIKEKEQKDQVQANHNLPNSPSFDNSIPWQRPDSARFYQDIRVKETKPKQETEHSFKFWYFFLLSVVLTLLYRSFTHRVHTYNSHAIIRLTIII